MADFIDAEDERQSLAWEALYVRLVEVLGRYGVDNGFGAGDYFVVDDNYGWFRHHVEVQNLDMLRPDIVAAVRGLLDELPDWQIVMQIDGTGKEHWPRMGLTIRRHEIIEVLQRDLLPPDFRQWKYEGGRPGTEYD